MPLNLRPVVLESVKQAVPLCLAMVASRLCEFHSLDVPPCVYFLISGDIVRYVGQSRNLPSRIVQHRQDGKSWERVLFIPILEADLNRVEAEWIKALQPSLNRSATRSHEKKQLTLCMEREDNAE